MSRSGYSDDFGDNQWDLIRWRGAVASAMRGRRGQAFLKEMLVTLDALPEKRLIAYDLEKGGEVCAIGAVGRARGVDMSKMDPEDYDSVAGQFGIATPLAQEIVYMNDDGWYGLTPEQRFERMRAWVANHIKPEPSPATPN